VAQQEITGGDVRAVLDGKYALTSEGYAEYRKCIAAIELGGPMKQYKAALEECKQKAKEAAFPITHSSPTIETDLSSTVESDPSSMTATELYKEQASKDRNWQKEILKR